MCFAAALGPALAFAAPCAVVGPGRLFAPEGWIENGYVRLEAATVTQVGAAVAGDGCDRVETKGAWLLPGFIDAYTRIGLVEVEAEPPTVDSRADATLAWSGLRPAFDVAPAFNPRSVALPVALLGGVTSAIAAPQGGLVSGQSAWVQLGGARGQGALIASGVAMVAGVGGQPGSRADAWYALSQLLEEAKDYHLRPAHWRDSNAQYYRIPAAELRAMAQWIQGERRWVLYADRASDIEAAIRFAEQFGAKLAIAGAAEGWIVADALAHAQVPVIVDGLLNAPETFDRLHARADNAALLHAAGVVVILSTFSAHNARTLWQVAGNAVRAGLPHDAALRAITSAPAAVFGLSGAGALRPGARADLTVWSGDPFEPSSDLLNIWVAGQPAPLRSRQTELFERYKSSQGRPNARRLPNP